MKRKKDGRQFDKEFENFVDDLGGLIWAMKTAHHCTWEKMEELTQVSNVTLINLVNRKTKSPMFYTCWKILRGLDHASVIRHSQLDNYRGLTKPKGTVRTDNVVPLKRKKAA